MSGDLSYVKMSLNYLILKYKISCLVRCRNRVASCARVWKVGHSRRIRRVRLPMIEFSAALPRELGSYRSLQVSSISRRPPRWIIFGKSVSANRHVFSAKFRSARFISRDKSPSPICILIDYNGINIVQVVKLKQLGSARKREQGHDIKYTFKYILPRLDFLRIDRRHATG